MRKWWLSRLTASQAAGQDMPEELMERIAHFFEHYKDLDEGKWVRVQGWDGTEAAKQEVRNSVQMYVDAPEKPNF